MEGKVKSAIEKIRPVLQRDGGDIEFVGIEDGIVKVRLQGACKGCPMSQMTVKSVVEKAIKAEAPEVQSVETV
ncbi:MAG: NifU family protein [Candidatus Tantalella remota]|nr:NifU family protein [Candidatus Tantalella remota]